MAELSTADRERVVRGLMRFWSRTENQQTVGAKTAEILVTVNETDDWIEANQASYNGSLTYTALFTAAQKTFIFCAVALARVSITILRRILGEVD